MIIWCRLDDNVNSAEVARFTLKPILHLNDVEDIFWRMG